MTATLLDLFCGAGGAAVGYHRAGFDVVGVDNRAQPHYPYEFHQADALEYVAEHGREFDMIHASPPCQAYSALRRATRKVYPDLIATIRMLLNESGKPYVIENVAGAPLVEPVMLCGMYFGLKVYRHRLFESNVFLPQPLHVKHRDSTPRSGHGKSTRGYVSVAGNGGFGFKNGWEYAKVAMGIDWMTREELSQAIPPDYTKWVGSYIKEVVWPHQQ